MRDALHICALYVYCIHFLQVKFEVIACFLFVPYKCGTCWTLVRSKRHTSVEEIRDLCGAKTGLFQPVFLTFSR